MEGGAPSMTSNVGILPVIAPPKLGLKFKYLTSLGNVSVCMGLGGWTNG